MQSAALDTVQVSPHCSGALQMLNSAQHCLQKRIFATTVPKTLVIGLDLSAPTATLN